MTTLYKPAAVLAGARVAVRLQMFVAQRDQCESSTPESLFAAGVSAYRALCALRLWMSGFSYDIDEKTGIAFWTRPAAAAARRATDAAAVADAAGPSGRSNDEPLPILFLHGFGVVRARAVAPSVLVVTVLPLAPRGRNIRHPLRVVCPREVTDDSDSSLSADAPAAAQRARRAPHPTPRRSRASPRTAPSSRPSGQT